MFPLYAASIRSLSNEGHRTYHCAIDKAQSCRFRGFPWATLLEEDILGLTGPGLFTDAVLDVLSESLPHDLELITRFVKADENEEELEGTSSKGKVTWAPFHHLEEPSRIAKNVSDRPGAQGSAQNMSGLLVLPVHVWGQMDNGILGLRCLVAKLRVSIITLGGLERKGIWLSWALLLCGSSQAWLRPLPAPCSVPG